jgi:outer membrane immunogenic protein
MKRAFLAAAAVALIASLGTPTQAQTNWTGPYVGASAGGALGSSSTSQSTVFSPTGYFAPSSVPAINSAGAKNLSPDGFIGGLHGGYDWQFPNNIVVGLRGEAAYMPTSDSSSSTVVYPCCAPTSFTVTNKVSTDWFLSVRPRVGYAIGNFLPYLTGGVSVTDLRTKFSFTDTFATAAESASKTSIRPGWSVGAGLEYAVANNWSLSAEYLYSDFGRVSTSGNTLTAFTPPSAFPTNPYSHSADLQIHAIRIGFSYHFAPPAPPPAATPVVAAPPAPPPAPPMAAKQMFIVFFEFDKSSLTPDGKKVVDAAAAAFKSGKSGVAIAGYTDLAGSAQYNLALSHRRADTVKAALVKDGVAPAAIDESWHGKDNPRVPTADGVREPQNRRVEITM